MQKFINSFKPFVILFSLLLSFLIGCNKKDPFTKGVEQYKSGNYEKAISFFNKELTENPNNENAYYERGNCKAALGNYKEAISDISNAIKINAHPAFLSNRSVFYSKTGNYKKALHDATQAIKLNESYVEAYINRAGAYLKLEKLDSAIIDYSEAIGLEPKNPEAHLNRALAYQNKGQIEEACNDWKVVHDLGYKDQTISFLNAYCE